MMIEENQGLSQESFLPNRKRTRAILARLSFTTKLKQHQAFYARAFEELRWFVPTKPLIGIARFEGSKVACLLASTTPSI
jgi:hypothetical protein